MKNLIVSIIVSQAIFSISIAQNDAQGFSPGNGETADFLSLQKQFAEWSKDKELSEEKGWKWYKRWEDHYIQRANGSGNLADPKIFMKEAIKFQSYKKKNDKANKYSWLPAGPDNLPPYADSIQIGLGRINCVAFHPTNSNIFWVGVAQGGIWKTSNGGSSWTPLNNGLPILRITHIAVDPTNADIIYACLGDYEYNGVSLKLDDRKRHTHYGLGIYKTVDGGQNWSATGLTTMITDFDFSLLSRVVINPSNTSELVAGGLEGIWRSTNSGVSWTKVHNNVVSDIEQVAQDPNVLYAATSYIKTMNYGTAGILKSMDFGQTWTVLNSGIPATGIAQRVELAVAPSDSSYVYAISCNMARGLYAVYSSSNGGMSWNKRPNSVNILNWDIGSGGQGTYDIVLMVDPVNKNKIYAGGINLWGSDNGGDTWQMITQWYTNGSIHADIHRLVYNGLNGKFYACHDGGINVSDNLIFGSYTSFSNDPNYRFPTNWTNITRGMQTTSFYRLSLRRDFDDHVIAGAQDNGTYYYNGLSWRHVSGGDGMECILHPSDSNILWTSYQYGGLMRFSPYYSDASTHAAISGEWTTPYLFDPDNDFLITGYDNVYLSTDLGDSYSQISNFPNMSGAGYASEASALAQSSGNRNTLYVAKRINHPYNFPSKLYKTHNLGSSWSDITIGLPDSLYFTYVYVDDDSANWAWVTVGGFVDGVKIFKTTDGGNSWQNISYNLPNVSTNCVVLDEKSDDHRLYLANDLGVFVTSDHLEEWIPFSNDLPNVIVSEIEIHEQSQSIYAATFGRGIWKTDLLDTTFKDTSSMISYINQSLDMRLLPNPNTGSFNLDFDSQKEEDINIEVIDIMGQVAHQEFYHTIAGSNRIQLNLSLSSGQYFLRLRGASIKATQKFVVQ